MFTKWYGSLINFDHVAVIETYCNEIKDVTVHGHIREEWGVRVYGPTRRILASVKCTNGAEAETVMQELENLCIRKNYDGGMSG